MKLAEELLKCQHKDVPREQLEDLKENYERLEEDFMLVCDVSSKQAKQIVFAVEAEMVGRHPKTSLFTDYCNVKCW